MKYELWVSESGYSFFPAHIEDAQRSLQLDPDAKLLHTIEADSWDEAREQQHCILGWMPYKPLE